MNPMNIVEAYISAGDQLDALWQFFTTIHLAIIAALYGIPGLQRLNWFEYSKTQRANTFPERNCPAKWVCPGAPSGNTSRI